MYDNELKIEESILGNMLQSRNSVLMAMDLLTSECFYKSENRILFSAMAYLDEKGLERLKTPGMKTACKTMMECLDELFKPKVEKPPVKVMTVFDIMREEGKSDLNESSVESEKLPKIKLERKVKAKPIKIMMVKRDFQSIPAPAVHDFKTTLIKLPSTKVEAGGNSWPRS